MAAFASFWTTKRGPLVTSSLKAPIFHWAPSPTSFFLEDKSFADLAPLFTNLRGAFGGRGRQDFGGSCVSSPERGLTAKARAGRSSNFLLIPDSTRSSVERKSDFFSVRSLHVGLGEPVAVSPGLSPCPSPTGRAAERGPRGGGPRWTPERGLREGELAPTAAGSNSGDALEPAARPTACPAPSAHAPRAEPDAGLTRCSASVDGEAQPGPRRRGPHPVPRG